MIQTRADTVLYLAKADNSVDPVPGMRLLEQLRQLGGAHGLPYLVFLATPEGTHPALEAGEVQSSLARSLLVELGIPAVLALKDRMPSASMQALMEGFYSRLRTYGEVDRALVETCAAMSESFPVPAVPALYSRLRGTPRIVKIFEPTFLLEVTPPTIAGLHLVFRPPVTDTHRQYGR